MKISDYCHEEDVILSPDVANLVDVLWNEATGSLSDILAVPVNTIKLEDVEKAEGILLLLKRSFDNVEDASKVKKLSDEFFSIIPHKSETLEIASRQEIAKKQDLCQVRTIFIKSLRFHPDPSTFIETELILFHSILL